MNGCVDDNERRQACLAGFLAAAEAQLGEGLRPSGVSVKARVRNSRCFAYSQKCSPVSGRPLRLSK